MRTAISKVLRKDASRIHKRKPCDHAKDQLRQSPHREFARATELDFD
jgi:hypothetical protein